MTQAEVLNLINNEITDNSNNEITAAVMRPVLAAMVNQINALVGNPDNLPDGETNVIEAINSLEPQGIFVRTGTADPNVTPPAEFNVGDFYSRTLDSLIISFWQFNGIEWIEVLSRQEQKLRNYKSITGNYAVLQTDDIIVYSGSGGHTITFLDATLYNGKIFRVVNVTGNNITTSSYTNLVDESSTTIIQNRVVELMSNGTVWQQVNEQKTN